jgi:hypothetical protein
MTMIIDVIDWDDEDDPQGRLGVWLPTKHASRSDPT